MKHILKIQIVLIFIGVLLSQIASGQGLMKLTNKKHLFTDGFKTTKLHEFEDVFIFDETSARDFLRFNRNRKTQKIINYTSLGLLGLGFAPLVYLHASGNAGPLSDDLHGASLTAVGAVFISSTTALIGNFTTILFKRKNKKKLLNHTGIGYSSSKKISMYIAMNQNGFGFGFKI